MIKEILKYIFENDLSHIPSALSMSTYIPIVFNYITRNDNIIIGKPFGAQTYYLTWKKLGWLNDIDNLNQILKHYEIDFVNFHDETIGNALGVAAGISLVSDKRTYVNISDASLQIGQTLEAIQFIGKHQTNVFVTVDFNNSQVTGNCSDIIPVDPVKNFFIDNGWLTYKIDGHNEIEINNIIKRTINLKVPVVIFMNTVKGHGVPELQKKEWHYRKLSIEDEYLWK
jgi:transketolase N-terminal domain/subunit